MKTTQLLFTYETAHEEELQMTVLERKLKGRPDTLFGYKKIEEKQKGKHITIKKTNNTKDAVRGMLHKVSNLELYKMDRDESFECSRISVSLKSGAKAWVYLPSYN